MPSVKDIKTHPSAWKCKLNLQWIKPFDVEVSKFNENFTTRWSHKSKQTSTIRTVGVRPPRTEEDSRSFWVNHHLRNPGAACETRGINCVCRLIKKILSFSKISSKSVVFDKSTQPNVLVIFLGSLLKLKLILHSSLYYSRSTNK